MKGMQIKGALIGAGVTLAVVVGGITAMGIANAQNGTPVTDTPTVTASPTPTAAPAATPTTTVAPAPVATSSPAPVQAPPSTTPPALAPEPSITLPPNVNGNSVDGFTSTPGATIPAPPPPTGKAGTLPPPPPVQGAPAVSLNANQIATPAPTP